MKRWVMFGLIFVGIVGITIYFHINKVTENSVSRQSYAEDNHLPTEQFIKQHLLTDEGLMKTNFTDEHYLSESIGLLLKYFLLKEDEQSFHKAIQVIEDFFLLDNHLITWEIMNDKQANTNALIDDLRIVDALLRSKEVFGNHYGFNLATDITKALVTYNYVDNYFVDFYDRQYSIATDKITLSYLNPETFQHMVAQNLLSQKTYEDILSFLQSIPRDYVFFPKSFSIKEQSFSYDETVHLIDQLYVSLHMEKGDIQTNDFFNWLKDTFYQDGKLYGRYDLNDQTPAVDYDSPAVYALAIIYSVERESYDFSRDLYHKMKTMQITDETHDYFGGYVHLLTNETHSFDNLLPLIAERILEIEKVIPE